MRFPLRRLIPFTVAVACCLWNTVWAEPKQKATTSRPATSWLDKRISLSVKDRTLGDTLREVMSGAPVATVSDRIDSEQMVSVQLKNKTVREALDLVLRSASARYTWHWNPKAHQVRFGYSKAIEADLAQAAKEQYRADIAYLAKLAVNLEEADSVTIFLLDPRREEVAEAMFPIRPYGSYTKILASKTFAAKDVKPLLTAVSGLLTDKNGAGGGALCHFPILGIRIYDKLEGSLTQNLLFETSFCWRCANYYVTLPRPDFAETSRWRGIPGSSPLSEEFQKLMPALQEERDRIEAKSGR